MSERLHSARGWTVSSIAEHGLLPAQRLVREQREHLASWTTNEDIVSGRLMPYYADNSGLTEAYIIDGLYSGFYCILPVMAERPRDNDTLLFPDPTVTFPRVEELNPSEKKIVQERMQSSLLIVCDSDVADIPDMMAATKVDPAAITDLLIPAPIWEQFSHDGVNETLSSLATVHVIDDLIERNVLFLSKSRFSVPNYEAVLLQFMKERKKSFWVHGVRLPIMDDLENGRVS